MIFALLAQVASSDPLVLITLAIIGASGPVLAAVLGYRAKRNAHNIVQNVHQKLDHAVGIPNGHGPLMSQTTELLNNQIQIQQHMYELNDKLSEHIYSSRKEVEVLHQKFDGLSERIRRHVDWEERNKYKADSPDGDKENKKGNK